MQRSRLLTEAELLLGAAAAAEVGSPLPCCMQGRGPHCPPHSWRRHTHNTKMHQATSMVVYASTMLKQATGTPQPTTPAGSTRSDAPPAWQLRSGPGSLARGSSTPAAAASTPSLATKPSYKPGLCSSRPPAASAPLALPAGAAMQDLAASVQKAFASGLGDWHLQPLELAAPLYQQRLLLGALGPEQLHLHHGVCC